MELETVHLHELNLGWKEIKLFLDGINNQIFSLEKQRSHYEQTLENLESVGRASGYQYSEEKDEWTL